MFKNASIFTVPSTCLNPVESKTKFFSTINTQENQNIMQNNLRDEESLGENEKRRKIWVFQSTTG